MASNTRGSIQSTIEELKEETEVTDQQLDTKIEQPDIPDLARYFDNINDGYLQKMDLTPGQQTDVREKAKEGTLAGMILALTLWLGRVGGTFRALIVILLSLSKRSVAMKVFKYLPNKDYTPSEPKKPKLSYRGYLQSVYKSLTLKLISQWPPVRAKKVINLAMIQKDNIQSGRINDEFFRQTITGKIDDILCPKTHVELKDILSSTDAGQKIVLIEGAPGSGKSTLALHICQEWAEEKLFQEFDIAILVRLRDPKIRDAKTIADILPCADETMSNKQENAIKSVYGKGVLWVLDGWDELPLNLPQDSIINKLIQRVPVLLENLLHKSTIIVTSRPSSSAELHSLVSSRVEVLGFTPHQLKQYFTECLKGDSQAVETLLDRIQENPAVEGSCYLPLNASIVVNCFLFDNHSLPTSNHEIFKSLVQNSLKRYLRDRLGKTTPVGNITSPDSLPSELNSRFLQICQLAYNGIKQNKVTFTDEDFTIAITKDVLNIGLLQSVPSIHGDGELVYYCFLHLSIQELLAAIHISLMPSKEQISVFQKLFDQPRFNAVFQFYAGITKLKTKRWLFNMLPNFIYPYPAKILDLVENIVQSECKKNESEPRPLLLSLMHCLYEAEDKSLCAFVANLLNHQLKLAFILTPIDCLSIGYFVSSLTTDSFLLDLRGLSLGDQNCKFLAQGLSKNPQSQCKLTLQFNRTQKVDDQCNSGLKTLCEALSTNTSLIRLNLRYFSIAPNNGLIPQILRKSITLQHLYLTGSFITGNELSDLLDALSTNTSLKTLDLRKCSLTIILEYDVAPFYQLLSKNNSLENLSLSDNTVISCRRIAAGLAVNKTLKKLDLANCKLTDCSVEELSTGLINNIECLNISNNPSITEDGMKTLTRHLTTGCPKLKTLYLPQHIQAYVSVSEMFQETNKQRKKNGLIQIEMPPTLV